MSRRLNQPYRSQELARLARGLLFAPPARRHEQVLRAERLHDEIDPNATYPLDYLTYRITHYRHEHQEAVLLVGEAVAADLRLIIDSLSRSFDFQPEANERLQTISDLARALNVSVKTVERWRKRGLRWRWVVHGKAGERRIVIPAKAVEHFSQLRPKRVETSSGFSHLSDEQRQRIIRRAQAITQRRDVSLHRLATHLGRRMGRAPHTVRFIIEKHDRRNPGEAIFDRPRGPLSKKQKRIVLRAYRRGVTVERLAQRFNRGRSTIYRGLNEMRLANLRQVDLSHHASPAFKRERADEHFEVNQSPAVIAKKNKRGPATNDLPQPLAALYDQPLPQSKPLQYRFLGYNYLKFRAKSLRDQLETGQPRAAQLDSVEWFVEQAQAQRTRLFHATLPVVLSVARRQLVGQPEAGLRELTELLELALPLHIEAISGYNPTRSQSFESFLTNRLLQTFARQASPANTRRKAHRRETSRQVLDRMQNLASEKGVNLASDV